MVDLIVIALTTGTNYARTCEDWLKLLLKNENSVKKDLKETYGDQTDIWFNRWIVFYLVSSEIQWLMDRVARSYLPTIVVMSGLWHIIYSPRNRQEKAYTKYNTNRDLSLHLEV
jgi:hypothetical protein